MEFPEAMYSAATNVNDARRTIRLSGHQCLDYLVKRPLIKMLELQPALAS